MSMHQPMRFSGRDMTVSCERCQIAVSHADDTTNGADTSGNKEVDGSVVYNAGEYSMLLIKDDLGTPVPIGRCPLGHAEILEGSKVVSNPLLSALFEAALYASSQTEAGVRRTLQQEHEDRKLAGLAISRVC